MQQSVHQLANGAGRQHARLSSRCWGPKHSDRLLVQCPAFLDALKNIVRPLPSVPAVPLENLDPDFTAWLHAQGVNTDKVVLQSCGQEGRGLVASTRIPRGSAVLLVPQHLIIDAETAAQGSSLMTLGDTQASDGLSEWAIIAAFLAELRFWSQQPQPVGELGPTSSSKAAQAAVKWAPYLRVLPTHPDTVLSWSKKEVDNLLQGSPLARKAARLQAAAQATWQEIAPLVAQAEKAGVLQKNAIQQQDITWALSIMLSRLVRLSGRGDQQALVPWADFLNHSPDSAAHLDWQSQASGGGAAGRSESAGGVVVVADREYAAGQQIYISYGQRSSGDLLLSYGFAPADIASHPHETVSILVGLRQTGDGHQASKAAELAGRGLPSQCEFPLRMDGLPQGLLAWAAFCSPKSISASGCKSAAELLDQLLPGLPQKEVAHATVLPEDEAFLVVAQAATDSLSAELQLFALKEVAACCSATLKGYTSTMELDRNMAARMAGPNEAADRAVICAAIRIRDRQILARVEYACSMQARELSKVNRAKRR